MKGLIVNIFLKPCKFFIPRNLYTNLIAVLYYNTIYIVSHSNYKKTNKMSEKVTQLFFMTSNTFINNVSHNIYISSTSKT